MENEVQPIDANAFYETLEEIRMEYLKEDTMSSNPAPFQAHQLQNCCLKDAPTIDPESLRPKGRCDWCRPGNEQCGTCIKKLDYHGDGGSDTCSAESNSFVCAYYKPMNYCPNCGTKMEV